MTDGKHRPLRLLPLLLAICLLLAAAGCGAGRLAGDPCAV